MLDNQHNEPETTKLTSVIEIPNILKLTMSQEGLASTIGFVVSYMSRKVGNGVLQLFGANHQ